MPTDGEKASTLLLTQRGKMQTETKDTENCLSEFSQIIETQIENGPRAAPKSTYSQMTAEYVDDYVPPSIEQGLIVDSFASVKLNDYIKAIGAKIDPKKIQFISRIAQQRVCFYVDCVETAQFLLSDENNVLNVSEYTSIIRPLYEKTKKVTISNVSPLISNKVIIQKLKEIHIIPKSAISIVKAGLNQPEFQHIRSFRRQVYISPSDVNKLPASMVIKQQINNMDMTFNIYFSTGIISCFLCHELGHIQSHCPNRNVLFTEDLSSEKKNEPDNTVINVDSDEFSASQTQTQSNTDKSAYVPQMQNFLIPNKTANKRTHPQSSGESNSSSTLRPAKKKLENNSDSENDKKNTLKKDRPAIDEEYMSLVMKQAAASFTEKELLNFPILIETFVELMLKVPEMGYKKFPELLNQYTENCKGFIDMANAIYFNLNDGRIKSRLTKCKKSLVNRISEKEDSMDTELSTEGEED